METDNPPRKLFQYLSEKVRSLSGMVAWGRISGNEHVGHWEEETHGTVSPRCEKEWGDRGEDSGEDLQLDDQEHGAIVLTERNQRGKWPEGADRIGFCYAKLEVQWDIL